MLIEATTVEELDAKRVLTRCVEEGADAVVVDEGMLPPEFFDLSTRLLGELLHELGKYRVRLAAVVPDPTHHSESFQAFMREANRGRQYRFFRTAREALDWIDSDR